MTLAWRLLRGYVGVAADESPPQQIILSDNPQGGWVEVNAPHAWYNAGTDTTFFGYVVGNDRDNNIEVMAYHHATDTTTGPFVLHANLTTGSSTTPDSHNSPALAVLGTTLVVAYCGHAESQMRVRICSDLSDITDAGNWSSEQTNDLSGGNKTYAQLALMSDVPGRIFNSWRGEVGGAHHLFRTFSDDGGNIWDNPATDLYQAPGHMYAAMAFNGVDRQDFVVTDTAPELTGGNGLWHFYIDAAGDAFETDGTPIAGGLPYTTSDLTEVIATDNDVFPYNLGYTPDGRPVVACATQTVSPVEFFEMRWSGSAWERHDIATTAGFFVGDTHGGGICHDPSNGDRVFYSKAADGIAGGQFAVYDAVTTDDGVTWTNHRQLTDDNRKPQGFGIVPGGGPLAVVYQHQGSDGHFDSGSDYSLGTAGIA